MVPRESHNNAAQTNVVAHAQEGIKRLNAVLDSVPFLQGLDSTTARLRPQDRIPGMLPPGLPACLTPPVAPLYP